MMASVEYKGFCTIKSRMKGHHVYRTNVRINDVLECKVDSESEHSNHIIVVFNRHVITGHVPDKLAEVLYQSLNDNIIKMKGCIAGVPQPAAEGRNLGKRRWHRRSLQLYIRNSK